MAASFYDYPPYFTLKPDLPLDDLLPPSEDDFDALNEFIPSRSIRITFFAPLVEVELMDHPYFEPHKECLFKRSKVRFIFKTSLDTPLTYIFLEITCRLYANQLLYLTKNYYRMPIHRHQSSIPNVREQTNSHYLSVAGCP